MTPRVGFDSLGQKKLVFEIPTLTLYFIFHHGKKDAYQLYALLTFLKPAIMIISCHESEPQSDLRFR